MSSTSPTPLLFLATLVAMCCCGGCSQKTIVSNTSTVPDSSTASDSVTLTARQVAAGRPFEGGPVDVCLLLSGQMYGYLQPCGCTRPQVGGLERRYELMKRLHGHGYPVSAADLGDLGPKGELGPQSRWKYETAANALKSMSYAALGVGPTEMAMPLETALDLVQNYKPPTVVAANVVLREPELYADVVAPWVIDDPRRSEDVGSLLGKVLSLTAGPLAGPGALAALHALPVSNRPRVGYFALVGESVMKECQEKRLVVKFLPVTEALGKHLPTFLAAGAEVRVLLFQGTSEEAMALLKHYPKTFHVVLCRNDAADGVAPLLPIKDDSGAWLVMVGHKGKTVGVVAYRRGKPLAYRLEELVEDLELPDGQTNPTREVMKDYVLGVYKSDYLSSVSRIAHPTQLLADSKDAVYVGAARCAECHKQAHAKWSGSQHSHAWESLVKYGRPIAEIAQKGQPGSKKIGRQFDPDCARCHVTGFGYRSGFESEAKTPLLLGNGCENCHGPGSLHAANPFHLPYREPMRLNIRDPRTEQKCRTCHDQDNDPHFDIKKWSKIEHGRDR